MADIKWIKIVTDIFDDEKMLLIETLPEADSIIVIWFKLLCLAGKQNNSGVFTLNGKIPYTDKMLATIFRRKETIVTLALQTFEQFGMIEIINNTITIPNWSKHQNFDKIEKNNQYMKNYMKEYRKKQKLLAEGNKVSGVGLDLKDWKYVLEEFDYSCAYCGKKGDLEQEHIIPFSQNGKYMLGNIVPACRRCNASKNDKNLEEWYELQEFYDEKKLEKIKKYASKFNVNINVSNLRKDNVSLLDKKRKDKIREDKSIIIENEVAEITKCYEENIGTISSVVYELLIDYLNDMDYQLIKEAIKIASINNKRNMAYIKAILNDWNKKGYKVLADIPIESKKSKREKEIEEWLNE